MTIGFIGQGYIGKNYADDFERRGLSVARYSLEASYVTNKEKIRDCDVVFIAVPTPTTPKGFDSSIVEEALILVGKGKIAVVKSTIVPGTTLRLQKQFSNITVLYSPEFLSEATAAQDAAHPFSNILGLPVDDEVHRVAAQTVLAILPSAPFSRLTSSTEAELIKYAHNLNGYFQIILSNILYDAAQSLGERWETIRDVLKADPYVSGRYLEPLHKTGRGAGGHCFIKDFAAFRELYATLLSNDERGKEVLAALEQKNIELLKSSGKDVDLLRDVYGNL